MCLRRLFYAIKVPLMRWLQINVILLKDCQGLRPNRQKVFRHQNKQYIAPAILIQKKKTTHKSRLNQMVPKAGLEPARVRTRLILSQVRLPIPPLRHDALNPSERFKLYYLLKDMSRHRLQNFCGIKSTDTLCVVQFSFAKHIVYLFRSK